MTKRKPKCPYCKSQDYIILDSLYAIRKYMFCQNCKVIFRDETKRREDDK